MQTVKVNSEVTLNLQAILEGIAQLDTPALESFLQEANQLLIKRNAIFLPIREAYLIAKIKERVPDKMQERYHILVEKMGLATITEEEHQELTSITDFMEDKAATRLESIMELSKLRKVAAAQLLKEFPIEKVAYEQKIYSR